MIRKKHIENIIFIFLILLNLNFFGLVSPSFYSSFCSDLNRTGEIILIVLLICVQSYHGGQLRLPKIPFWSRYIGFVFFSILICGLYSIFRYNESLYDIYVMENCMITLLLIYALYNNFTSDKSFMKILLYMVIICIIVECFQSIVYNSFGIIFVRNLEVARLRNSLLRYGNSSAYLPIYMLLVFGGSKLVEELLPKVIRIVGVLLGLYALVFVEQTRVAILAFFVSAVLTILIKRQKFDQKCVVILALMVVMLWGYRLPQVQYIIQSLLPNSNEYISDQITISVRQENIAYRLGFIRDNPLFGMGIIRALSSELKSIAYGPQGLYFSSDVGVIDTFVSFGIFGIIMIVAIWVKWFKKVIFLVKNRLIGYNAWYIGVVVYYLITSLTLGYFATSFIMCFVITNAILDFNN